MQRRPMRLLLLAALLDASGADAQTERFAMEVTTDRETYGPDEAITVRVEIQNVSGERSTIWAGDRCAPVLRIGSLFATCCGHREVWQV